MITRFVCLANSYKHGGRCIAGIQLDNSNQPIISNGRPVWIRPVGLANHGEVPTHVVSSFNLMDIVQVDVTGKHPDGHQSENVTFTPASLAKIGDFGKQQLDSLCDVTPTIFGNRGKAVSPDAIANLKYSLMLIKISDGQIDLVTYPDRPDKPQVRLKFTYNGKNSTLAAPIPPGLSAFCKKANEYNLPITDPAFLNRYANAPNILAGIPFCYLCLSLGTIHEEWYSKLVAGVIF